MMSHVLSTVALAALAAAPGTARAHRTPARAIPQVTVVATDYALAMPDTLTAGAVSLRVANHGRELHQVMLARLLQGKSASDLVAAMKAGGPPPAWAIDVGGPNGVDPGHTSLATTLRLLPGHYAAFCIIPSPDGTPHLMKGMIRDLVVKPGAAEASFGGPTDATLTLYDYGFRSSRPIDAHTGRVLVRNEGKQVHELELARLAPGKTAHDIAVWVEKMAGPPPAHFLGGVSPIAPGQENELSLDLAPGRYALLCFVPDAKDGKPHIAHGMVHELEVK